MERGLYIGPRVYSGLLAAGLEIVAASVNRLGREAI